jgi:enamine deaminase RidA (YjgF/YER057c/UK114 family)
MCGAAEVLAAVPVGRALMTITRTHTGDGLPGGFPFSLAAASNGTCFISGMPPLGPDGRYQPGTFEEEVALAWHNIAQIAVAAGYAVDEIIYVQAFSPTSTTTALSTPGGVSSFPTSPPRQRDLRSRPPRSPSAARSRFRPSPHITTDHRTLDGRERRVRLAPARGHPGGPRVQSRCGVEALEADIQSGEELETDIVDLTMKFEIACRQRPGGFYALVQRLHAPVLTLRGRPWRCNDSRISTVPLCDADPSTRHRPRGRTRSYTS